MIRYFILSILLFLSIGSSAQDISNRGKEFWLGYSLDLLFFKPDVDVLNGQELVLYISTEQAAIVTVSLNGTTWSKTLNIPANKVDISVKIPKAGPTDGGIDARLQSDGLSNRGIHIVSDVPVAVFAHHYSTANSAATMLMPVESWGYKYHAISYTQNSYGFDALTNTKAAYSFFYITATEDGTKVEITPIDSTENGWLPNQPNIVSLDKGQVYVVFGKNSSTANPPRLTKDMTGSKIISIPGADGKCHPIGVFSGSGINRICDLCGGEPLWQQVFPEQAWGTKYLTYHTILNNNPDFTVTNRNYYRICLSDPTAIVKRNGIPLTGLINNFYYEYVDSTGGDFIESDKPILVAQYMINENQCWNRATSNYGDPEMIFISPMEQGQKSVRYYVTQGPSVSTPYDYTNVYLPTAAVGSLKVDGVSVPSDRIIPHPKLPSYSVAFIQHPVFGAPPISAQHTITCDSNFTGFIYGLGPSESYGYNLGSRINNLNNYSAIQNVDNTTGNVDTFTCPTTAVRFDIKLGFQANAITWKLSQVSGLSITTDSIINNPIPIRTETINGRTYYVYTLQQDFTFAAPGTYTIPYTYSSLVIENCSKTEFGSMQVVVKPGPTADFDIPTLNCQSDTLTFTAKSIINGFNINKYLWNFDDATTQNTLNARKHFLTAGTQNVRYRIYADNGCTGDITKPVSILANPVAKFGYSNTLCKGDSLYLTDTSAVSGGGSITKWEWDFGDTQKDIRTSGAPFYHKYTAAGNYTISLVVTSSSGCKSDTLKRSFTILPQPNATFTINHNICLGDSVLFTDKSYIGQNITNWLWDLGDTHTLPKTDHLPFYYTYTTGGNFTSSLIVTDNNGCKSTAFTVPVIVTNKPVVSFTFNGKPCIDSTLTFTSSIAAIPATWYWDFGDTHTITSTSSNIATHTYTNLQSNVTIKHAVVTGCASDTSTQIIPIINANPTASFNIIGDSLCEKKALQFTARGSTDITNWAWNFGSGGMQNITPPFIHAFSPAGTYTISLNATTAAGCGAFVLPQKIAINALPDIYAGPDLIMQENASKMINASNTGSSVYQYLWSPNNYLDNATLLTPTIINPLHNTTYTIQALDLATKCINYDSMTVKVMTQIFIPNTFTPNGDSRNDTWEIPALEFYPNAKLMVYSRYGELVFRAIGKASWDGTYKGRPQPTGTYVYIIQPTGNPINDIQGTVTIIR